MIRLTLGLPGAVAPCRFRFSDRPLHGAAIRVLFVRLSGVPYQYSSSLNDRKSIQRCNTLQFCVRCSVRLSVYQYHINTVLSNGRERMRYRRHYMSAQYSRHTIGCPRRCSAIRLLQWRVVVVADAPSCKITEAGVIAPHKTQLLAWCNHAND